MKKTLNFLVVLAILLAIVACNQQDIPQSPPSESPSPAITPEPTPDIDTGGEGTPSQSGVFEGGQGNFELYFVEPVNFIGNVARRIVGEEALDEYIKYVLEPNKWDKETLPMTYRAIQHFNISKEDFIKYNNDDIAMGFERTYADWMIDALYCGDEEEMVRLLLAPTTLYANGELFNVWEVSRMDEERRKNLGLMPNEWQAYVDGVETELDRLGASSSYQDLLEMLIDPNYKPDWDDEWVED
jgi:hypothetical protein